MHSLTELSNKLQPACGNKREIASFPQHSSGTAFLERQWSKFIRDGSLLSLVKLQQEWVWLSVSEIITPWIPCAFGIRNGIIFSACRSPAPVVLQLFSSSLLGQWQLFGKSSLLPSPALSPLLLCTKSPVLGFWGQPWWGFASSESFLFSTCMAERNVTVAVPCRFLFCCIWATNLHAVVIWVMLFLSPSPPHILMFSYFQNLQQVFIYYFRHKRICSTGVSKTGVLECERTNSQKPSSFLFASLFLCPFFSFSFF